MDFSSFVSTFSLVTVFIAVVEATVQNDCQHEYKNKKYNLSFGSNGPMEKTTVCFEKCIKNDNCAGANFDRKANVCHFLAMGSQPVRFSQLQDNENFDLFIKDCSKMSKISKHGSEGESKLRNCGIPKTWPKQGLTIPKGKNRIVSGYESTAHSFPWIASMSRQGAHNCGGSIIRCPNSDQARVILSAAHCFYGRDNSRGIAWRVGTHDLSSTEPNPMDQVIPMETVEIHEKFNEITMANDISLIKLTKPVNFSEWVQPICLPERDQPFQHGMPVIVSGWGASHAGGGATVRLQQVDLKVIDTRFCNRYFHIFEGLLENQAMICAGYRGGKYDACQVIIQNTVSGDSGGPLITEMQEENDNTKKYFVLAGAVSFGEGCAVPTQPGIYTKISNYLDWIDIKMKKMC